MSALTKNKSLNVGKSMSTNLLNLPLRPHYVMRRSHSTTTSSSASSLTSSSNSSSSKAFRVVVLGVGGVGKTALTVRFMTNRYIGDYDPNLETIYCHSCCVDDNVVEYQVLDTAAGQSDESLLLEDKCKWGEGFLFVYDVTDKYSFDELTRLKFIASYTHSRMRGGASRPCWALVGNKTDLAENERMVSVEEGRKLAAELGCHIFREISVKESIHDARDLYADLWREYIKRCPRTSGRRKLSGRIYDRIPVLRSRSSLGDIQRPLAVLPPTRECNNGLNGSSEFEDSSAGSSGSATPTSAGGRRNAISLTCDPLKSSSGYFPMPAARAIIEGGGASEFCRTRSVGDMRVMLKRR